MEKTTLSATVANAAGYLTSAENSQLCAIVAIAAYVRTASDKLAFADCKAITEQLKTQVSERLAQMVVKLARDCRAALPYAAKNPASKAGVAACVASLAALGISKTDHLRQWHAAKFAVADGKAVLASKTSKTSKAEQADTGDTGDTGDTASVPAAQDQRALWLAMAADLAKADHGALLADCLAIILHHGSTAEVRQCVDTLTAAVLADQARAVERQQAASAPQSEALPPSLADLAVIENGKADTARRQRMIDLAKQQGERQQAAKARKDSGKRQRHTDQVASVAA